MRGPRRSRWGLALQVAGTCLLAAAVALEVTDQPLPSELALSLAAATPYLAAAPLYTAGRRTWMVVAGALALMLAVASLVRITEQPVLNALHVLPLLLVAYTASTIRSATHRDRGLQRERVRARHDGAERERRRWARELHDDTLQELGAVQVVLSAAAADGRPEAMHGAIEQARSLVGNQITSLRHLITDLRPLVLDELGLRAALEALCRRTSETFGIRVDLRIDPQDTEISDRLTSEAQAHVYRIVQEALTNAVKHAQPTRITVGMEVDRHVMTLTVADDGHGMPQAPDSRRWPALRAATPPASPVRGVGLSAMHERADLIDARLTLRSVPGKGTTIILSVPLASRRKGHAQPSGGAPGTE
ncbi:MULTISPECIES: sensor histidine kinase [unclassified Streptomyces]|uniref:sensor histidine kinase n=1 Tax=unclassified Streptomyces TaxID=2593676 RepID=UPI002DD99D97|nr:MULTISPECIES: sensor histidine kinase [unclassified Streptomyces]WSC42960.1 sensor histidine kinase [Streptomyces sp. NBC_01762]WSJ55487.1 sensor histidine kinase [Streptomyces sp. NBC_01318]